VRRLAGGLLIVLFAALAQAQPAELARAEALIREGRPQEALSLLLPLEAANAGTPAYDYLLGIAALEAGDPSLATLVLERVVAVNPGHMAARLEMGRGYFALGDTERARQEFEAVLRSDPPPAQRALIERYLERIRHRPAALAPSVSGYVEASLGRDSHVNAGVAGGGVLVAAELRRRESDTFAALGGGLGFSRDLGGRELFAGADVSRRMHFDLDEFDALAADLNAGVKTRLGERDSLRLSLQHAEYDARDSGVRRRIQGAAAQWTRRLARHAQLSAFGEALRIRYRSDAMRSDDSDMALAGVRASRALDATGDTLLAVDAYGGHDNATAGRVDGDRRMLGASGTLTRRLASRLDGHLALAALESDYDSGRRDRYYRAAVGASRPIAPAWRLSAELSRMHNRSSEPGTEYGRTEAVVSLRRSLP
jgi:tetratricopeptide (TPR) repeat protein